MARRRRLIANMTVLEQRFMEQMPALLKKILEELTALHQLLEKLNEDKNAKE